MFTSRIHKFKFNIDFRSVHSTNDGEAVDQIVYHNQQPGIDYSISSGARRDVYSSHLINTGPQHIGWICFFIIFVFKVFITSFFYGIVYSDILMTYIQSIFLGSGPRPNSAHNVFSYDPNPSSINYNSPNHQSQQQQQQQPPPNNINRINKTSPAPAQTAWTTLRQVKRIL